MGVDVRLIGTLILHDLRDLDRVACCAVQDRVNAGIKVLMRDKLRSSDGGHW